MGNLFRCPPNMDKKEYILKAGGVAQGSYTYTPYTTTQGEGSCSYTANSATAKYYATCAVYYKFDATKWNKIYIKKLYCGGFNNNGKVGVCTANNPSAPNFEYATTAISLTPAVEKDQVLDISKLTGEQAFFIYANTDGYSTASFTFVEIRGDVYLSEK